MAPTPLPRAEHRRRPSARPRRSGGRLQRRLGRDRPLDGPHLLAVGAGEPARWRCWPHRALVACPLGVGPHDLARERSRPSVSSRPSSADATSAGGRRWRRPEGNHDLVAARGPAPTGAPAGPRRGGRHAKRNITGPIRAGRDLYQHVADRAGSLAVVAQRLPRMVDHRDASSILQGPSPGVSRWEAPPAGRPPRGPPAGPPARRRGPEAPGPCGCRRW